MKFLKKSSAKVAVAPVEPPAPTKSATQSSDTIDVIIQINEKKSADQLIDVAEEGITIKVNDKAVSLEPSATSEEGQKFVDDLQHAVEEDATKKEEEQQQAATSILGKLMFWKATEKPVKEEKTEEIVVEEAQEQEQEQEQEEPVEEKEEAEPAAEDEVEATPEQEDSGPFGFLQNKLTFWQEEAAKEQKEEEPVSEESKPEEEVKPAEVEAVTETAAEAETEPVAEAEEKKEVEDEVFGHKIEVFVDGVAIQTIRLTNSGMDHLKNFIASVQEEARLKGESVAVTKTWLAEKMSEFFESAKEQGNAEVSDETPAPSSDPAPAEEEKVAAEIDTQPSKSSWWPFSKAEETAEETAVDEVRSETAEEVEVDATEHMREVAETA